MAETLMTAEDAAKVSKWSTSFIDVDDFTNANLGVCQRILATYAECARLRAALTEREGECERLTDLYNVTKNLLPPMDAERDALRQRVAEGEADTARLDWLEQSHTLHDSVEMLYVVDGYEARIVRDDRVLRTGEGTTLRVAIDAARGPRTGGA